MKVKTAELSGIALDWVVAQCEGAKALKKLEDHLSNGVLPYCFDLYHDIKMYYEAIDILAGRPHSSGLGAEELRNFASEMGYVIDKPVYPPYSTDWAQGGPIIEREWITLVCAQGEYNIERAGTREAFETYWLADIGRLTADIVYGPQGDDLGCMLQVAEDSISGPTPLVAAMRCYVASKLGYEVEVPDELFKGV